MTETKSISRAWYSASIEEFLNADPNYILGQLARNCDYKLLSTQTNAWLSQIEYLKEHIVGLNGSLFFEFNIPRMGRRIDVVLLIDFVVFVIEFKVGEKTFSRSAIEQVWDYALDLKNFHEASHTPTIVPILIATEAKTSNSYNLQEDGDKVLRPILLSPSLLRETIENIIQRLNGDKIDYHYWSQAPYHPTPTIIEAARALYAQHSVEAIARYDAGAKNLYLTSQRVEEIIELAKSQRLKIICFVTGVPGAGKTLVGLNIATHRRDKDQTTHAVYLSGNGPLVAVLREALTRDEVERKKNLGERILKGTVRESVKSFIQNVHHFRDDALINHGPMDEHVAIFDEAQRAWNLRQTANFMHRKKNLPGFTNSEPEFLISCMDRHSDWAVIVCLVGGGQEINIGEAGIDAWLDAINQKFPHWHMYISSRLTDSEYASGKASEIVGERKSTYFDESLHLAVSMRSFRSEHVSSFVKALLDCETQDARAAYAKIADRYPMAVTRNLARAKHWIRSHARGSERFGLVASSKAQRLKPHAIDIRVEIDPVHWFLNDKEDTRSSYYLEDAATEFQVQGLELDWVCVTWDGDLRFNGSGWDFHDFRGARWNNINNADNRRYLRNAYRVLLTRARQGMIIFVPEGDPVDPTRSPMYYDSTFRYLSELGVPELR